MTDETKRKGWQFWVGWVLTALPSLALVMSGTMKLTHAPDYVAKLQLAGFPDTNLTAIGLVEIMSVLLLVIPRTAVLGAILVTGYLGGAICVHVRTGDPGFVLPAALGVLAWGGVWLREPRLRAIAPLRT